MGFQRLNDLLSQATVLCYPSLTKDFELQADASAVGLGAVLEQNGHVVAYASRSLTQCHREGMFGSALCCEAIQTLSTCMDKHLSCIQTINHYNGCLLKRWRVGYVVGHLYWHCRNLILQSNIDEGFPMQMLMPFLVCPPLLAPVQEQ